MFGFKKADKAKAAIAAAPVPEKAFTTVLADAGFINLHREFSPMADGGYFSFPYFVRDTTAVTFVGGSTRVYEHTSKVSPARRKVFEGDEASAKVFLGL